MGPFAFAATGVFFCSLVAGGGILLLHPRSFQNRAFFALAVVVSFWNLVAVVVYSTENVATAQAWLPLGMVLSAVTGPTLLVYAVSVSNYRKFRRLAGIAYLGSIPFIYRAVTAGLLFEVAPSARGLRVFHTNYGPPWFVAWVLYLSLVVGCAVFVLLRKQRFEMAGVDPKSNRWLAVTVIVWLIAGAVFDFAIGPLIGLPAIAPLLFLFIIVQTTLSVLRRHFMARTPGLLSRSLLNNIEDGIALVDSEARLLLANARSETILGAPAVSRNGRHYPWLLAPSSEVTTGFTFVASGRRDRFVTITEIPGNPEKMVHLDFSAVHDGYCGDLGVLIQSREAPSLRHLLRKHHITRREWQVVMHVAAGESYRLVAKDLGITVRTVKAHVASVYTKLRVDNRVQLLNKLSGARASPPQLTS